MNEPYFIDNGYIISLKEFELYEKIINTINLYENEIYYLYSQITFYASLFMFSTIIGICMCTIRESKNNYKLISNKNIESNKDIESNKKSSGSAPSGVMAIKKFNTKSSGPSTSSVVVRSI